MKTLQKITGIENKLINLLILSLFLFICSGLLAVLCNVLFSNVNYSFNI